MVTIQEEPDCGNAPRKEVLRDLVVALAQKDADHVASLLSEDIAWTLVGERHLAGRTAVVEWVTKLPPVDQVAFGSLLTHGRGASVDGVLELADGTRWGFCHVLRFAGATKTARLVSVNSYLSILETPTGTP